MVLSLSISELTLLAFAQLCDLYENDSIFDKFECCLSGDGQRVSTGSYRSACVFLFSIYSCCLLPSDMHLTFNLHDPSNLFRVFGCSAGSSEATSLEASKNPMRYLQEENQASD